MRFAYLILAHDGPAQVAALVERLCPAGSPDIAVLHIDAKSPLAREAGALAAANPAIRLVERPVAVRWGHASMVEAMRRLLRTALAEGFTHAHLLSGSDWPVAPRAQITAEIGDRCWIEAVPGVQAERMERCRLDSRWLRPDPTRLFDWYRARLLREISARLPHRTSQPASQPWGPWHKGSQWWSLPHDVCAAVLRELDKGFAEGHFRFTVCADEHAIQTIAAHLFPDRITHHRHFLRWPEGASSPAWLTAADWPAAEASGAWFARKLSANVDPFFLTVQHPEAGGAAPW